MKLKVLYTKDYNNVYVYMHSPKYQISWFLIFDYTDFYKRYHPNHQEFINMPLLKEDLVDSFVSSVASVPYSKEDLIKDIIVDVQSDLVKKVEL